MVLGLGVIGFGVVYLLRGLLPRWLAWILVVGLAVAIKALLSRGKTSEQRLAIGIWSLAVVGFGVLGYELWRGAYITGAIIFVVLAFACLWGCLVLLSTDFGGAGIWGAGTKIEVTKDAVIINRKKFRRADFGGFNVDHTLKGKDGTIAVLGYKFGRSYFPFGGTWPEGEAMEVASALNDHLRSAPVAGEEKQMFAAQLRTARLSDF